MLFLLVRAIAKRRPAIQTQAILIDVTIISFSIGFLILSTGKYLIGTFLIASLSYVGYRQVLPPEPPSSGEEEQGLAPSVRDIKYDSPPQANNENDSDDISGPFKIVQETKRTFGDGETKESAGTLFLHPFTAEEKKELERIYKANDFDESLYYAWPHPNHGKLLERLYAHGYQEFSFENLESTHLNDAFKGCFFLRPRWDGEARSIITTNAVAVRGEHLGLESGHYVKLKKKNSKARSAIYLRLPGDNETCFYKEVDFGGQDETYEAAEFISGKVVLHMENLDYLIKTKELQLGYFPLPEDNLMLIEKDFLCELNQEWQIICEKDGFLQP